MNYHVTRRTLLSALAPLLLIACAGPRIFHQQLSTLDKGLSSAEAIARLKLSPLSTHKSNIGNRLFDFHRYSMYNGMNTDLYFLAYEQDRLVFWGYVSEFRRHPDTDLSLALNAALREVAAISQR
jgi:hypothetical protein